MVDLDSTLATWRETGQADVPALVEEIHHLRHVQSIILREAGALLSAWRGDWSGTYFDGRDTFRLFKALEEWVKGGAEGEFTRCYDWHTKLIDKY